MVHGVWKCKCPLDVSSVANAACWVFQRLIVTEVLSHKDASVANILFFVGLCMTCRQSCKYSETKI